jgi:hypothetical protein
MDRKHSNMSSIRGPQTEYSSSDQDEAPPVYSHVIPEALTLGTLTTNSADIAGKTFLCEFSMQNINLEQRMGELISMLSQDWAERWPALYLVRQRTTPHHNHHHIQKQHHLK